LLKHKATKSAYLINAFILRSQRVALNNVSPILSPLPPAPGHRFIFSPTSMADQFFPSPARPVMQMMMMTTTKSRRKQRPRPSSATYSGGKVRKVSIRFRLEFVVVGGVLPVVDVEVEVEALDDPDVEA